MRAPNPAMIKCCEKPACIERPPFGFASCFLIKRKSAAWYSNNVKQELVIRCLLAARGPGVRDRSALCHNEVRNPFVPGAGTKPPELAGRDEILKSADVAVQRVLAGKGAQSQMLLGLRGVGKTVLLNKIEDIASVTVTRPHS